MTQHFNNISCIEHLFVKVKCVTKKSLDNMCHIIDSEHMEYLLEVLTAGAQSAGIEPGSWCNDVDTLIINLRPSLAPENAAKGIMWLDVSVESYRGTTVRWPVV